MKLHIGTDALKFQLFALDRCIESQRAFARDIDNANPGDPYASLMVHEDIQQLEVLRDTLREKEGQGDAKPIGYVHPTCIQRLKGNTGVLAKVAFEERISTEANGVQTVALYVCPPAQTSSKPLFSMGEPIVLETCKHGVSFRYDCEKCRDGD